LYTFRFIRHFHEEDRNRIYQNIRTCLKPGGLLMFDVVNRTVREKRDARNRNKAKQELEVYDVTYTPAEFTAEMKNHGFEVLAFKPVIQHFELQSWVTRQLDRRLGQWAHRLVRVMEAIPSADPLEWVVLCRRDHEV
jgi:SAM-dependent methyltransferase